jgi:hypothetical protein
MPLKVLVTSAKCPEGRWDCNDAISLRKEQKEKEKRQEKTQVEQV